MLIINCTKKLLSHLNAANLSEITSVENCTTLGLWYANLFDVEYDSYLWNKSTETYLLMVNSESLLSFHARMPDELSLEQFFAELPSYLDTCFVDNGFTQRQRKHLISNLREVGLGKATNQSMLGYIRSYQSKYTDHILQATPYEMDTLGDSNRKLTRRKGPNDMKQSGLVKPTPKRSARYLTTQSMRRAT